MGYALGGGLLLTLLSILLGIYVSEWVALTLAILYFIGLVAMITFHTKRIKKLEK